MKILKKFAIGAGGLLILLSLVVAVVFFARNTEVQPLDDAARAQAPGDFVELEDGITHYELAGPDTGQVIVLVHGFSVPSYVCGSTFNALAEAGFRALRYDAYGRGYSDRPAIAYDRALFERQLDQLIDALELRGPVDLVGLSMGGAVVAGYAAGRPAEVRRLVLIDPLFEAVGIPPIPEPLGFYLMTAFHVPQMPANQMTDFYRPEHFPEWEDRYREQMKYEGFSRAIVSTVYRFLPKNHLEKYRQVAMHDIPSLLIWGKKDRTIPFSGSETVREAVDAVEFLAVEEAGHLAHLEQPEIVNRAIINFLTER